MEAPFKVIREGKCKLDWGLRPDGRYWIGAVCTNCKKHRLAVGTWRLGVSFNRSKFLTEAMGYWKVRRQRQQGSRVSKRGWAQHGHTISVIKDLCSKCVSLCSSYIREMNKLRGLPPLCTSYEQAAHLYVKWQFVQLKRKFRKLMEVA